MISSAGSHAASRRDSAPWARRAATVRPRTSYLRRSSMLPSRRAILHVRAADDQAAPLQLARWYTERAFNFYETGLRISGRSLASGHRAVRHFGAACTELDAACSQLRDADGMASIIVAAHGRSAFAAALWQHARRAAAADALILYRPVLPAGPWLHLDIDCPVLVLSDLESKFGGPRRRRPAAPVRTGPAGIAGLQLGRHVTWVQLASEPDVQRLGQPDGTGRALFFEELGRWLGAYMYGAAQDQLL